MSATDHPSNLGDQDVSNELLTAGRFSSLTLLSAIHDRPYAHACLVARRRRRRYRRRLVDGGRRRFTGVHLDLGGRELADGPQQVRVVRSARGRARWRAMSTGAGSDYSALEMRATSRDCGQHHAPPGVVRWGAFI